jgi:hypothetical protein
MVTLARFVRRFTAWPSLATSADLGTELIAENNHQDILHRRLQNSLRLEYVNFTNATLSVP